MCSIRNQSSCGLQVACEIRRGRATRTSRPESRSSPLSASHRCRARGYHMRFPPSASILGCAKTAARSSHEQSRRQRMASSKHDSGSTGPARACVVPPIPQAPNDLWTADFKGEFKTANGIYCYPLTIADQHKRFLLSCHGLLSTQIVTARPVFERAFGEYGLPKAIRTDNGVPFATQASTDCPISMSGGCVWGFNTSASFLDVQIRAAHTNECTAR